MTPEVLRQQLLAAQHEAIWLYALIGGRFDHLTKIARSAYSAHRAVRDDLVARLDREGATPIATALAYDVGTLKTAADAGTVAQRLERRVAALALTLVGLSEGADRSEATRLLGQAALAELTWGAGPQPFPGLSG